MKKILSLSLPLLLIVTIFTLVFADDASEPPSYLPPEIQSVLSKKTGDRWYPLVQIENIDHVNMSFDEVKASAKMFETFYYDGDIPTGTTSFGIGQNGEFYSSGSSRLMPDNLASHQYPNDVKSFGDADIVILTDPQTVYVLTSDEIIIPLCVADQKITAMSVDQSCSLKDFLNAAVYRNRYVDMRTGWLGGSPTSVLSYLGYKPPVDPIVYVIIGVVVLALAAIVIVYLRKRKSKKNSV